MSHATATTTATATTNEQTSGSSHEAKRLPDRYRPHNSKPQTRSDSWEKPWQAPHFAGGPFPRNYRTGKPYRGINIMLLWSCSYCSPFWLTFNQAKELKTAVFARAKRVAADSAGLNTSPFGISRRRITFRVLFRALIHIDPYQFTDDVAAYFVADDNNQQTAEEVLTSVVDGLDDEKLNNFALRLILTTHAGIPRENEIDSLTEAEQVFAPPQPKKLNAKKKVATKNAAKKPAPVKSISAKRKTATKRKRLAA